MVYAPRKITFPFFIIVFSIVFLGMLYLVFLNKPIDVSDNPQPVVSVVGDKVVLKMTLVNNTKTIVNGITVEVRSDQYNRSFFLKSGKEDSNLAPGERYDFVAELPVSKTLKYDVLIYAPFSAPKLLNFKLNEENINPISANVENFPTALFVGENYDYLTKICNISKTNISEVRWFATADRGYFKEQDAITGDFVGRAVGVDSSQCKTFYSTLTPIKAGNVQFVFRWKVGDIEQQATKDAVIEVR
ncbi:Uncharacterised protein [uncultured archaeon]|nr:Uncharacterised protein [uncultured archaeon]